MHILVLGAAGMVGRKLCERLLRDGRLGKSDITKLTMHRRGRAEDAGEGRFYRRDGIERLRRPGRGRKADRRPPGRHLPSRRDRVGRSRARFRQGLPHQSRRHADAARRRQACGRRLQAARGLHLLDRGVRRAVPRGDRRRVLPHAAAELRHPEGDRRTAAGRLFAPRLPRRHRHPPADHLHPARPAQQGGIGLLLQHPARAARRQGGGAAGLRGRPSLARHAALRRRLPAACRHHGPRHASVRAAI